MDREKREKQIKKTRKLKPVDVILYVLLVVFAAGFVFGAYKVIEYVIGKSVADSIYNEGPAVDVGDILSNDSDGRVPVWTRDPVDHDTSASETTETAPATSETTRISDETSLTDQPNDTTEAPAVTTQPEYSKVFLDVRQKILDYRKLSSDVVGIINIPELNTNYPIVQRKSDITNKYYLTHGYTGEWTNYGSIFLDYRVSPDLTSRNTVIYGHNMRNGKMFGRLDDIIADGELFDKVEIVISTLDGIYTYKLFSCYETTTDFYYCKMNFISDTDYMNYINTVKAKSLYEYDGELTANDRILTLSTCTNVQPEGRYAFHAVLVSIER